MTHRDSRPTLPIVTAWQTSTKRKTKSKDPDRKKPACESSHANKEAMPKAGSKLRRVWSENARLAAPPFDGPCVTHRGRLDIATRSKCAASGYVQAHTALSCTRALSPLSLRCTYTCTGTSTSTPRLSTKHTKPPRGEARTSPAWMQPLLLLLLPSLFVRVCLCARKKECGAGRGGGRGHKIYRRNTHTQDEIRDQHT